MSIMTNPITQITIRKNPEDVYIDLLPHLSCGVNNFVTTFFVTLENVLADNNANIADSISYYTLKLLMQKAMPNTYIYSRLGLLLKNYEEFNDGYLNNDTLLSVVHVWVDLARLNGEVIPDRITVLADAIFRDMLEFNDTAGYDTDDYAVS